MTEKLELKHLSPYLPYGLKMKSTGDNIYELSTYIRVGGSNPLRDIYSCLSDSYKPILRPLSDYVDINSESFMDINIDLGEQIVINQLANKGIGYWHLPYSVICICFEHHIDVFGLIEKGLAVSIHDMESAPKS